VSEAGVRWRNPNPEHGRREKDPVNRLVLALSAFVGLGILSWTTLSDQRIRLATLAILAMFAMRTWVRRKDAMPRVDKGDAQQ
jgi:hypothetical protein